MDNFDDLLIEAVKGCEILYNRGNRGYTNTQVKANIWRKIAEDLGSTEEECIKKWRSLRDRFVREDKKLFPLSGKCASNWELYESLAFLKDHVKPRVTKTREETLQVLKHENEGNLSNLMEEASHIEPNLFSTDSFSQTNSIDAPRPKKKKTDGSSTADVARMFESAVSAFKNSCESEGDTSMHLFMKSMALKLEKLPLVMQNNAIVKISKYVIKLESMHMGLSNELPDLE